MNTGISSLVCNYIKANHHNDLKHGVILLIIINTSITRYINHDIFISSHLVSVPYPSCPEISRQAPTMMAGKPTVIRYCAVMRTVTISDQCDEFKI